MIAVDPLKYILMIGNGMLAQGPINWVGSAAITFDHTSLITSQALS